MTLNEEKLRKLWPDAKTTEIAQCRQALTVIGFELPMFAMVAASIRIRITDKIDTAAINRYGVCFVNPEFVRALSMQELGFVLTHEMMHLLTLTLQRMQHREPRRWNRASDRAINQVLLEISQTNSAVLAVPKEETVKPLFPLQPEHRNLDAERLYELEPETPTAVMQVSGGGGASKPKKGKAPSSGGGGADPNQQPRAGQGCGIDPDLPNDEGVGEDVDPSTTEKTPELMWRALAEQAKSLAAGTSAGQALARVIDAPKARISWQQLLRHTISQMVAWPGRDDQSWTRRNRRYYGSRFIMPGYVASRKNLCIIVDTSGSMSDTAIARCVAEVAEAAKHPEIRIYMVVHDVTVQWQGWVKPGTTVKQAWTMMKGRGGTSFEAAYAAVAEMKDHFDTLVHLTDGGCFGEWPEKPKNVSTAIAALVGYGSVDNAPDNYRRMLVDPNI